ncbi:conjugal transfer protein [Streptomyces albireticuli]|nr:conjugal transfer protein [Streptomyces albireticuli]MCD9143891.1 conjugal transfer protein [Streptomyces albireticuli]MCD9161678.1 conjugal transfer protein [Streptomyces albireticuli]MCD9192008.1 conjugal transfer protein [Streptomyces albireticuli]
MSTFKTVMRRILNLPEPRSDKGTTTPLPDDAPPPQPVPAPAPAAPPAPAALQQWTDAAARLQAHTPEPARPTAEPAPAAGAAPGAPSGRATGEGTPPWQIEDEKSGAKFAVKVGRGVLWGVVALAAITGVRSWIWTPEPAKTTPVTVDSAPDYPVQEAQAVAARFARSYLAWDEADPQARSLALARDLPKGADTTRGWNSKGRQEVLAAQPGTVSLLADKRARVRVDVLVKSDTLTGDRPDDAKKDDQKKDDAKKDDKAKDDKAKKDDKDKKETRTVPVWMGLEVPVVQTAGHVVVTGQPGIVGVPTEGPAAPQPSAKSTDLEFADKTRATAEEFFTKYAAGEPGSVAAPGVSIPALPHGMTLGALRTWTVEDGSGTDRTGTAVVTWQVGGAELEQTYRVKLTRVSSAKAERWQVAEVHGGLAP